MKLSTVLSLRSLLALVSLMTALAGCGPKPESSSDHAHEHGEELHADEHESDLHEEDEEDGEEIVIHLDAEAHSLELSTAGPGLIRLTTELPGEVQINGDRMAHVTPRVSGVVTEVRKSLGDSVKAGEILAVLESRELADIKAEYLGAVARLELAQATFEREERLHEQRVSAEQDFLDARNGRAEARIELRSAQQKLVALGFSLDYLNTMSQKHGSSLTNYTLTAPFDGMVIDRHLVQGESVAADAAVFTIADLSSVWVDLKVYQKDIGSVRALQEVVLRTDHGDEAIMTLDFVQPLVGEDTRTALARAEIPNPSGHWHPGCFVTGTVTLETINAPVVVPLQSIVQMDDGDMVVFVTDHDGYTPRPLEIGRQDREMVEIIKGLDAGETYVSQGAFVLKSELLKGSFGHGHAH